jgi:hypothetical protein
MDYWQRVTIQDATQSQTGTGNVRLTWDDLEGLEDVEARVLPLAVDEKAQDWATPEEDAYEVHLRGAWAAIRPRMRVVVGDDEYDIRRIVQPPPFGEPSTVLLTVKVTR